METSPNPGTQGPQYLRNAVSAPGSEGSRRAPESLAGSRADLDRAIAKIAASQYGLVTRSQILGAGATDRMIQRRLQSRRWDVIRRGVYRLPSAGDRWRQSLLAVCIGRAEVVASHRSAAALFGLPGFKPGLLEVSVARGLRLPDRGVIIHESTTIRTADLCTIDGILSTDPGRTLIDLAAMVTPEILEEALDDAIRRKLVSLPRLRWKLNIFGRRGRPGILMARRLVEAREPAQAVPQSALETRMLRIMKQSRLGIAECQHQIREKGRLLAVVDFAYVEQRIAIEVDGYRYHSGRQKWEHDLARSNLLMARGWRLLRFTSTDLVTRPKEIRATIAAALRDTV